MLIQQSRVTLTSVSDSFANIFIINALTQPEVSMTSADITVTDQITQAQADIVKSFTSGQVVVNIVPTKSTTTDLLEVIKSYINILDNKQLFSGPKWRILISLSIQMSIFLN